MKKYVIITLILIFSVIWLSGCSFIEQSEEKTISIAEQYGLAYAPVTIMKELNFLEEAGQDIKIEWKKLSNTAAIRESMLAGEVDVGFMAIPPFLIGSDKGMDWKMISGLSESPLALMTNKEHIKSLEDLRSSDKIVLPQPGSIQHILLSMAAEREFGDAARFDDQLVSMNHPDGMNALLSGREISAHFTSPPYIFMESQETGIKSILTGEEAMGGEFTFIVGTAVEEFYSDPELSSLFIEALNRSIAYINNNPQQSAQILAKYYDLSEDRVLEYISWEGMKYTSDIKGVDKFLSFMNNNGYISMEEYNLNQLIWDGRNDE